MRQFKGQLKKASPSMVTAGNIMAGFMGIAAVLFFYAKGATYGEVVLIAMAFMLFGLFCDVFDGALARRWDCETALGEQLDSLADLVTFGILPAIVAFLNDTGHYASIIVVWSIFVSTFYVIASGYRLARYNAGKGTEDAQNEDFLGLPIPAAALVFLCYLYFEHYYSFFLFDGVIPLIIGVLMVSTLQYPHLLKNARLKRRTKQFLLGVLIFLGALLLMGIDTIYAVLFMFTVVSTAYLIMGPVYHVVRKRKLSRSEAQ